MKRVISSILLLVVLVLCLASCQSTRYLPVFGVDIIGPYFTVFELPTKELGGETTLEFWIGEYVTEDDYDGYATCYSGFYGAGYEPSNTSETIPTEYYVKYRVGRYPTVDSPRKGVLEIIISDPDVKVFGLTTESGLDEFEKIFISLGATVTRYETVARAKLGDVWFKLDYPLRNAVPYITIGTSATGAVHID